MKINVTTLGCPKNLVDSEFLLGGLKGCDVQLVDDPLLAETLILNTCGFIQGAKEESIDAILEAVALKKSGSCKRVFVTGCLSQRYATELRREIPEVDGFFGNRDMNRVIRQLTRELDLRREILGERILTTPSHYAYLKISEGCEHPCTFCSIPGIRGKFKSRPMEDLIREAQSLADSGVRELIIVAQDSTVYGQDLYGEIRLLPLLRALVSIRELKWMRLLYTYPANFSAELIDFISEHRNILNYVDMPIQHISDRLLRKMARKTGRRHIEDIIAGIRHKCPGVTLRTTLMVGFPGETEQDHEELCEFIGDTRFERLGLFAYSSEEDTPAFNFPERVPENIVQERLAELNDLQCQISEEMNQELIGTEQEVLIEEYDTEEEAYVGRSVGDCPQIDNRVLVREQKLEIGRFYLVNITGAGPYELVGKTSGQMLSPQNIESEVPHERYSFAG